MQAKVEVDILELLRDRDPEGKYNCGKILSLQCLLEVPVPFNLQVPIVVLVFVLMLIERYTVMKINPTTIHARLFRL